MSEISNRDTDFAVLAVSDKHYLSRCAVMLESSKCGRYSTVLALDESTCALSDHFPGIKIVRLQGFLEQNPRVARSIEGRSSAERIFSVGPSALLGLEEKVSRGGWLVYADSDLLFLGSLKDYLDEFSDANVVITPHRHHAWNKRRLAKFGEFNVGLVAFRNNDEGLRALRFWAESCLDWCYDKPEDGKYADQKYLEQFSSVASGIYVDNSLGANLAPWNSLFKRISVSKSGEIFVGKDQLVYFHVQGLKQKNGRWILGHLNYLSFAGPRLKEHVYKPYLEKLEKWAEKPGFEGFGTSRVPSTFLRRFAASVTYALSLLTGQTIKVRSGRL